MAQTARGEFVVSLKSLAFEGAAPEFKLGRMSIDKQISGDLTASTMGQMLSAMTSTSGSAGYVTVGPDSGTEDLVGLEGEFKINIEEGKHYYEFTYRFPAQQNR